MLVIAACLAATVALPAVALADDQDKLQTQLQIMEKDYQHDYLHDGSCQD